MKKMFGLAMVLTAVCAAVMLAGCGKKAEKKVIRMATEATFPPYEYFEKGKIVGIDADIVTEIAKTLGYETEIIDMKFDSVILAVQTGKCEIAASGITVTEERKKQINFTIPYVTATQVIIVPKNSPLKTPDSLKDKKIRIHTGCGFIFVDYIASSTGYTLIWRLSRPLRSNFTRPSIVAKMV